MFWQRKTSSSSKCQPGWKNRAGLNTVHAWAGASHHDGGTGGWVQPQTLAWQSWEDEENQEVRGDVKSDPGRVPGGASSAQNCDEELRRAPSRSCSAPCWSPRSPSSYQRWFLFLNLRSKCVNVIEMIVLDSDSTTLGSAGWFYECIWRTNICNLCGRL